MQKERFSDDTMSIPQEALSLYISVNPRDMLKATKNSLIEFANLITSDYNGYNPHQKVLSNIQTSCSRKIYMDFDYDGVDIDTIKEETQKVLDSGCLNYLVTRGGVHCLVELAYVDNKKHNNWYKSMQSIVGYDNTATDLMPIPGTFQGGFCPQLIPATNDLGFNIRKLQNMRTINNNI